MNSQEQLVDNLIQLHDYLDDLYSGDIVIDQSFPLCYLPDDFVTLLLARGQLGGMCHVQSRSGLVFDTNGDILLCNTINNARIVKRADYSDGLSLIHCLNSQSLKADYREILRYPSDECSICKYNNICRGGCLMNWTHLDPDLVCHPVLSERR